MSCYCDYEPADVYRAKRRTARKSHHCYECDGTIRPGEHYEHAVMLYDGRWQVADTCPRCLALMEFVQAHIPCLCWLHGSLINDCTETAQEYAHETVGLLFGAYRRKVLIHRGRQQQRKAA